METGSLHNELPPHGTLQPRAVGDCYVEPHPHHISSSILPGSECVSVVGLGCGCEESNVSTQLPADKCAPVSGTLTAAPALGSNLEFLQEVLRQVNAELGGELAGVSAKLSEVLEGQARIEAQVLKNSLPRASSSKELRRDPQERLQMMVAATTSQCDVSRNPRSCRFDESHKHLSERSCDFVPACSREQGESSRNCAGPSNVPSTSRTERSGRFVVTMSCMSTETTPSLLFKRFSPLRFGHKISKLLGFTLPARASLSRKFVTSTMYEYVSAFVIFSSAVSIGVETASSAKSSDSTNHKVLAGVFDCLFLFDLLIRIWAFRKTFFIGREAGWNWMDLVLVILCGSGNLAMLFLPAEFARLRSLTALRLLQLLRTMRMFRTIRSIREFRKMSYALLSSLRTLVCSLVLLFFVLYFFGILFCQAFANHRVNNGWPSFGEAEVLFRDLPSCFLTLFMTVTNGVSWRIAYDAVVPLGEGYSLMFLVYLFLVLFGVMNVVTSVFVESAILSAQHSKDLIIQEKQNECDIAMGHMKQVFQQIDEDGSGEITGQEMEVFFQDPSLRKYVEALEINAENARMLFRLLDKDGSKKVDIDEFCQGCMRLQGDAKSFDVHMLMFQIRLFLAKWSDFTVYVEDRFAALDHVLGEGARPSSSFKENMVPVR